MRNPLIASGIIIFLMSLGFLFEANEGHSQLGTQRAGIFLPTGATPVTASATGTTAATTATLAADSPGLRNTYICGFSIHATATGAAVGDATVTGTVGGTMHFSQFTQALATGMVPIDRTFTPCVPSSAPATAIAVVTAAPGSGGVVSVSAWGYQY